MRSGWRNTRLLVAAGLVLTATAALGIACSDDDDEPDTGSVPTAAATRAASTPDGGVTPAATAEASEDLGETPGWAGGQTGTVFYTKPFFCDTDPCVAGVEGTNPTGVTDPVPSVWVLVPLFAETDGLTFHCNTEGMCPTHPTELDVSRLGLGQVIPLPPHSHIIDPNEAGFSAAGETPWKVVVVGVNTRAAWDKLEAGKSIEALREVQAEGEASATGDVPTNLVLFFGVR